MTCLRTTLACSIALMLACGPKLDGADSDSGADGSGTGTDGGTEGLSATDPGTTSETASATTGVDPETTSDGTVGDDETGGDPPPPVLPTECGDQMITMPIAGLGQARVEPGIEGNMNLRLSKFDFVCEEPFYYPECGGTWNLTINIPPSAQQVGSYDLGELNVSFSESDVMRPPDCGGSTTGGGPGTGTLEILAWEEGCIAVRLTAADILSSQDLDGEVVATRCP